MTKAITYMRRALPLIGLIALVFLFFWKLAFTNLILARGDVFLYFYPYWDYRAEILRSGHLPLWNPYLFMGAPFLANSQAGVLYPLNWPLIWLAAPEAVKVSTLVHVLLAAIGAWVFARRALKLTPLAASLSATVFSLGGYFTAQVEHVNQIQGLTWFPWLLYLLDSWMEPVRSVRQKRRLFALMALVVALQLLAGHAQSAFISLSGAAAYWLYRLSMPWKGRERVRLLFTWSNLRFPLFVLLGGLIASAQVLPTLELSGQSLRGGGLSAREAVSFSLHPLLVGRALLPGYSRTLFTEFVGFVGVIGLALAVLGFLTLKGWHSRQGMAVLAGLGLLLAFGGFNPAYYAAAHLPPLDFFRVPARWLFLFTFGAAMLAGIGLDDLAVRVPSWKATALAISVPSGLMAWSLVGGVFTPPGEIGPLGLPGQRDWVGWLLALALVLTVMVARGVVPSRIVSVLGVGAWLLVAAELFVATRLLPFNHPTLPQAYASIRPAQTDLLLGASVGTPPPRFLSMSALRFDPGDLGELRAVWDSQLPEVEVYDAIVATKHKEVMSPDLPLLWHVPAVDGYDGGILPLRNYADFVRLFSGSGVSTPDGRLKENLTEVPASRWLGLANVGYLVTDKGNDLWLNGVYFDQQLPLAVPAGAGVRVVVAPLGFSVLRVLFFCQSDLISCWGSGYAQFSGSSNSNVIPVPFTPDSTDPRLAVARLAAATNVTVITIVAGDKPLTILGASLVDERTGAFQTLTLGPFQLAHSGDVKVYKVLDVMPRAFAVGQAVVIRENGAALDYLRREEFQPDRTVILADGQPIDESESEGSVEITAYSPERVSMRANLPESGGYVVLTDAYYPGWQATLDGAPVPIRRADVMFRAVQVPGGEHTVEFVFAPLSLKAGVVLSLIGLALWLAVFFLPTKYDHIRPASRPL